MDNHDSSRQQQVDAVRNILFGDEKRALDQKLESINQRVETLSVTMNVSIEQSLARVVSSITARFAQMERDQDANRVAMQNSIAQIDEHIRALIKAENERVTACEKSVEQHSKLIAEIDARGHEKVEAVKTTLLAQQQDILQRQNQAAEQIRNELTVVRSRAETVAKELTAQYISAPTLSQAFQQVAKMIERSAPAPADKP